MSEPQHSSTATATAPSRDDDAALVRALRAGEESAFATLVDRHHSSLVRVAMTFVGNRAVADEVAQETWLAVLEGIDRFEERSSLRTWLFRILANRAKTRGEREGRTLPMSSLARGGEEESGPVVDPDRFRGDDDRWAGHWSTPPRPWEDPERRLLSLEARDRVKAAIDALPESQRIVVTLRDVEGLPSEEVCDMLGLSEGNQRVILHRARARVRNELERYLDG